MAKLVEALNKLNVGEGWAAQVSRVALAEMQPPTEYERKVAQMKEDFPNGI